MIKTNKNTAVETLQKRLKITELQAIDLFNNEVVPFTKKLNINISAAVDLVIDDRQELTAEEKKAYRDRFGVYKNIVITDAKKASKKITQKVDIDKMQLLNTAIKALQELHNIDIIEVKQGANVNFNHKGQQYTIKLIKHRPQKK